MRFFLYFLFTFGSAIAAGGILTNGSFPGSAGFEIAWGATTNEWPEKLWCYKVVPQEFSPAIISNLFAISGFTIQDRTNKIGEPPVEKSILYFRNADESKHLEINPALGWIE
ncbi:MAG TPA: hypothetical protein VFM25_04790, partial [Verrucomicrobiae bacterium]|nr:hypothetical protein [Verrucomicrobiae bacterium]